MRKLYLDLETSDVKKGKRRDPSPFLADNFIVSYGYRTVGYANDSAGYHFLCHRDFTGDPAESASLLRRLLADAEVLVAFNAKFELNWLLEAGFDYAGPVIDPMVTEYVLARGTHVDLDLDSCCARRGAPRKLGEEVDALWKAGLSFQDMPLLVVQRYGTRDVECLVGLEQAHEKLLSLDEHKGLMPTLQMSWDFVKCLVEMERNGIHVDAEALQEVKATFTEEHQALRCELEAIAQSVMGDTPINLDSPEQLSWLIYSRKVKDKDAWAKQFNIGTDKRGKRRRPLKMSASSFVGAVRRHTEILKQTHMAHCVACNGRGMVDKFTKFGELYKRLPKCGVCDGAGYILANTGKTAGFKLVPRGPFDTAAGGFATDKETLGELARTIDVGGELRGQSLRLQAKSFLEKFVRYNAIGTYLETFVRGIEEGRNGDNGLLHTQLMQCITRTGRLSSQRPNFQNMPRANTFPVRRVVKSRWGAGTILEIDFAQLEFRIAAYLAQDRTAIKDIFGKVDAHAYTANIIGCSRQDAKPHTFKPLYGGSSGTEAEQRYYKAFKEKYHEVTEWQDRNINNCLKDEPLVLPSGREYIFPGTRRTPSGYVVNTTQICNYPVQGFATADVVPVTIIEVCNALASSGLRSLIILTVHDSIVFDVYPGELEALVNLINRCFGDLPNTLRRRYGIVLNVPLGWEIKGGPDWLNLKKVYECALPSLEYTTIPPTPSIGSATVAAA